MEHPIRPEDWSIWNAQGGWSVWNANQTMRLVGMERNANHTGRLVGMERSTNYNLASHYNYN